MPRIPIHLVPGIDSQSTPASGATGWNESKNIRFFQGLIQKSGGFQRFTEEVSGGGRPVELRSWAALSGIHYLATAGQSRVSLFASDTVSDITPVTQYSPIPMGALTTLAQDATITITDPFASPIVGDWIRIRAPVSVAGLVLEGGYEVTSIVDGMHYTIAAPREALSAVTDGGSVRVFDTILGSSTVTVTFPDHALFSGEVTRIPGLVIVGGLTLQGNYVAAVIDPNTFTINAAIDATGTATADENNNNMAVVLLNPPVLGAGQFALEVESVDLDNWGEFLLIIPQGGPVFVWMPSTPAAPATNVLTAPQANASGFVSTQQQILVLCGSVNLATGLFDPLLVRWSDSGDYTQFIPLPENQAGSFRLQLGSAIIAGLAVAGRGLVWTDLGLYAMQYEQPPLVWGFQPIGVNCGLIGPKAMAVLGETVVWMSQNQFYVLAGGGSPQVIPCSVWDLVFKNIDPAYARESVVTTNAFFGEIAWYVPQLDGTTTKARLNIGSGTWDYTIIEAGDTSNRSAGIDQNVFGPPFGASPEGVVYREETGTDADDEPLPWRMVTGIAQIAQGDQVAFFSQIIPDIKFSNDQFAGPGTVKMTVYVYRDPQSAPRVKGPYLINARTRSIPCRGRGRGLQFEFSGDDKGSSPRLGLVSYRAIADGRGG